MKRGVIFAGRNFKECVRDPLAYIFCIGFPLLMLALFAVINAFLPVKQSTFEYSSLVAGILPFGFTFVMLTLCLLVSKDCSTAFLKRLKTSPMRSVDFVFGYAVTGFVAGVIQAITCVAGGALLALITGDEYFSFGRACLLVSSQIPVLLICVFTGIFFGSVLNEKAAPALTSVFITASGVLGGAWMPLDTMGSFETICRFLPFYPSVCIGRVITGAYHSITDYATNVRQPYSFDTPTALGIITIAVWLVVSAIAACLFFGKKSK